jgi:CRAL/TRIO domain
MTSRKKDPLKKAANNNGQTATMRIAVKLLLWALLLQGYNGAVHGKEETNICYNGAVCKTNSNDDDSDQNSPGDFFGAFRRLGTSWKSMAIIIRNVVRGASGTQKDGDVFVETMEEALILLTNMVSAAAVVSEKNQWLFRTEPLQEFGLELEDIFKAFLNWAAVDGAEDNNNDEIRCRGGVNGRHAKINVSKAFRRLERYAEWMDSTGDDLVQPPLTASSLTKAWEAFSMNLSYDRCARLVWWLDLSRTDLDAVRALPPKDILRFYVWFSHLMLFDKNGQNNGVVFVQSFARISLWSFMTMLPLELGIRVDEFMISVIPLKTKIVLFLERPPWVKFGYSLVNAFLTRAMKKRVLMVPSTNTEEWVENVVGAECIPTEFDGLNGTLALDPFEISSRIQSSNMPDASK